MKSINNSSLVYDKFVSARHQCNYISRECQLSRDGNCKQAEFYHHRRFQRKEIFHPKALLTPLQNLVIRHKNLESHSTRDKPGYALKVLTLKEKTIQKESRGAHKVIIKLPLYKSLMIQSSYMNKYTETKWLSTADAQHLGALTNVQKTKPFRQVYTVNSN